MPSVSVPRSSERIADGGDAVADLQNGRIAELSGLQPFGLDLQNGKIARLVAADDRCGIFLTVSGQDAHGLRAFDHMMVRDDISVLRHDNAGPAGLAGRRDGHDGDDASDAPAIDLLQAQRARFIGGNGRHACGRLRDRQLRQLLGGLLRLRRRFGLNGRFRFLCCLRLLGWSGLRRLRADGQKKAGIRPVDRHADIAHQMHRAGHGQRQQAQDQNSRDPFSGVPAPAVLHRRRLRLPVLCGIVVIEAIVVKAHIRHPLAWLCT